MKLPVSHPISLLLLGAGLLGCQNQFPIKETNAGAPKAQCLPAEQPMAALAATSSWPTQACIARAQELTASLSPREKYGQMMLPDRGAVRPGDAAGLGLGTILSGGGSAPPNNTPLDWAKMVNDFREQSLQSRSRIPVMYGIDAVHGHNNVRGAVIFPHNIGLGATRDPELVQRIGHITAKEVAATNIDWTFAPVVTAARDERWGRTYEAFGETPELAELLGPALIRGLQGQQLGKEPASVLACAKHFAGDGYTLGGKDRGDSPLDLEQVRSQLLPAYQKAIDAGVGSIMVSFSSVRDVPMHCHGPLLNDVLKGEMKFGGFLVSDWEAIELLPGNYEEQLTASINAGVDMVMAPKKYAGFVDTMEQLVPARIPQARVDDAVQRILAVKCELGMLEPGRFGRDRSGSLRVPAELLGDVGSEAHRSVAREAVQKSLVLLKNEQATLPLKAEQKILLAGAAADDLGKQCGGWTISWQGQSGDITEGTTLLEALKPVAPNLTYEAEGRFAAGTQADVAVVVVSEPPYAEYSGDSQTLQFPEEDLATYQRVKALGIPTVLVMFSGRPMILGELAGADAIVAAFLPGSEGAGMTDVLFGNANFSGKLSHSWPKNIEQVPINVGDASYDPLWAYDYGLSYPEGTVPESTVPESTVPESSIPEGAAPAGAVPEGAVNPPTTTGAAGSSDANSGNAGPESTGAAPAP